MTNDEVNRWKLSAERIAELRGFIDQLLSTHNMYECIAIRDMLSEEITHEPSEQRCEDRLTLNDVVWRCTKPANHRDHERQPESASRDASSEPCEHLRSEFLAQKLSAQPPFEMRKCLDCTKIFRKRLTVKSG